MSAKVLRPLALAAAVLLAACGRDAAEPIYIGLAGPLTAASGVSMKRAAEMAVAEINAAGGIDGRMIELVEGDDQESSEKAIAVATALARDPRIVAVIGHVGSAMTKEAAPVYNGRTEGAPPVLQISPASSSPELTGAGEWSFRVTPTDLEFSPVLAHAAATRLGRTRAAVLYENDNYGQGVRQTFEGAFGRLGGTVVSADPFVPAVIARGDELDPYLVRAFRRGADALVIGGKAEAGVKIIQAARRLGYTGPILGADGLTGVKDAGPIAEGVYVSSAFLPDRDSDPARDFVRKYRAEYDALPDHRGAMTYDILYLLRDAIEAAGTDRRRLRDHVARIGTGIPAHEGVSGTIGFDENGDVRGKEPDLGVVRRGELVTARQ